MNSVLNPWVHGRRYKENDRVVITNGDCYVALRDTRAYVANADAWQLCSTRTETGIKIADKKFMWRYRHEDDSLERVEILDTIDGNYVIMDEDGMKRIMNTLPHYRFGLYETRELALAAEHRFQHLLEAKERDNLKSQAESLANATKILKAFLAKWPELKGRRP